MIPRLLSRSLAGTACLVLAGALGACSTADLAGLNAEPAATASTAAPAEPAPSPPLDAIKDDLALGKEHFRAENYGLAELHFRRATEKSRGDAEAWLGLAASYDRLKRYDLADRAYRQAQKITGRTAEYLNNRGYSYLLRGDLRRASEDLFAAASLEPDNELIRNNLKALDARARKRI